MYRLVLTSVILLLVIVALRAVEATYKGRWRRVEAISGREAILPCEVGSIEKADMIYVVLWYQGNEKEPIYSYDNRPRSLQTANERHVVKTSSLKDRVTFHTGGIPALHIRPVLQSDAANYTCRVDFRLATSRRTHLNLHVVVPPGKPAIQIGGKMFKEALLGPLLEGQSLNIACSVAGGVPPPSVVWLKNNEVIDSSLDSQSKDIYLNQLTIRHLTRNYHDSLLTCTASNNNVTAPSRVTVGISMNLKPLHARLVSPPKDLRMGEIYEIKCLVVGSRPDPNVTWTLGNISPLTTLTSTEDHQSNATISTISLQAKRIFHGHKVTCTAFNSIFPAHTFTDSFLLNVTYPPIASIELGTAVKSVVKEGEDVYFNCNVDSNPPTYKVSWYHEDRLIDPDKYSEIVVSGQSLAIRQIRRKQSGRYVCSASNVEGDAYSSPINLQVSYAPVCNAETEESRVVAVGLGHVINITCGVSASPKDLKFSWVFNNSVTSERVGGNKIYTNDDGDSTVSFIARSLQDYGSLQCWAQNSVGKMNRPCLYHIMPAGRPDAPVNCSVVNKTYVSLVVKCSPGFNGGLPQQFISQVFEATTGTEQVNVTSEVPHFILEGLTPGLDYVIHVRSRNSLGHSDPVRLEAFTYKMAENRMRDEPPADEKPIIPNGISVSGVLSGSLILGLLVAIALALSVRCFINRRRRKREEINEGNNSRSCTQKNSRCYISGDGTGRSHRAGESTSVLFEVPVISIENRQDPLCVSDTENVYIVL